MTCLYFLFQHQVSNSNTQELAQHIQKHKTTSHLSHNTLIHELGDWRAMYSSGRAIYLRTFFVLLCNGNPH